MQPVMLIAVNERIVEPETMIRISMNAVGASKDFDSIYRYEAGSEHNSLLTLRDQYVSDHHTKRHSAVDLDSPACIANLNVFKHYAAAVCRFDVDAVPRPYSRSLASENDAICVLARDTMQVATDKKLN